jgi:hypothetical protein
MSVPKGRVHRDAIDPVQLDAAEPQTIAKLKTAAAFCIENDLVFEMWVYDQKKRKVWLLYDLQTYLDKWLS